jgi:hypothetical protein
MGYLYGFFKPSFDPSYISLDNTFKRGKGNVQCGTEHRYPVAEISVNLFLPSLEQIYPISSPGQLSL